MTFKLMEVGIVTRLFCRGIDFTFLLWYWPSLVLLAFPCNFYWIDIVGGTSRFG